MTTTCMTEGSPAASERSALRLVAGDSDSPRRREGPGLRMELADALAGSVDETFERLVRVFQDRLYSFALRLSGSREDAEEVVQDAFVRAYRALKTYPAERIRELALQAWLYRITLNVARNRIRGKRVRHVSIENGGVEGAAARRAWEEESDDPAARPDSRLESGERRASISSLVATLPEKYRSAIILRYVEGLSLEEVAEILKQPLGTAKSNVHRAVNLLRRAITNSRRAPAHATEVRA